MKRSFAISLSNTAAPAALCIALLSAAPAFAQDARNGVPVEQAIEAAPDSEPVVQDDADKGIVVTGTLIRGIAPVGAPVLSIGAKDIALAGVSSSSELLRKVPQVANIGADESKTNTTTNLANANNTFGNGINIRGLGTQATLTLVNGFRPAPGGIFGLFFDPNTIPTIAIGGVDVVADGASALYGSDAIAGVVNLKLRTDVDGVETSARYGVADDYHSYLISGIAGKRWANGRVMLAAEHSFHTALYALDRPDQYQADQRSAGGPDLRTTFSARPNIAVGTTIYGVPVNTSGAPLTFANLSATPNMMSGWTGATALPEQRRTSVVFAGEYDVAPSLSVYSQAYYSKRDFSKSYGRIGLAAQQSTLTIPSANPNFIIGVPGAAASQSVRLSWLDILGPEDASGYQKAYQFVAGGRYDLTDELRLDVSYNHSYNQDYRLRANQLNLCALQGLTTPITPVCTIPAGQVAGGAIAQPLAANAFNPFGANNAAVIDRLRAEIRAKNFYREDSFTAKVDGKLFPIWGGDVRFAIGATTMRESAGYEVVQNNDTADNSIFRTQVRGTNTRRVNSVYGEMVLPLISAGNAIPAIQSLSVSVAGRYDHYSDQGSTSNPKFGVTWGVIDGLKLRGSYGKSFRASLIQTDPAANGGAATRPLADYRLGAGATTQFLVLTGGNRDLKPESARTINLGVDYTPDFARGLSLSATYFDIDYSDIIDNPGNTIGTTGVTSAAREATYAQFIQRRPTDAAGSAAFTTLVASMINGPLLLVGGNVPAPGAVNVIVDGRTFNSGRLKARGVDFTAFYNFNAAGGDVEAGVVGTYYTKFDRTFSPLEPLLDRRSMIEFPTKYNLRGSLTYQSENLRIGAYVNYLPSYTNTFTAMPSKVASYTTVDLSIGYTFKDVSPFVKNLGFAIEASNLFDRAPPLAFVANQLFDSNNASALGRHLSFRIRTGF